MEDFLKNSLMGQLKKSGFPSLIPNENFGFNFDAEDFDNSPFKNQPEVKNTPAEPVSVQEKATSKRLNDLDGNILQDSLNKLKQDKKPANNITNAISTSGIEFLGRMKSQGPAHNKMLNILYKFFPSWYKGIMVKKALIKLKALNITANDLIMKKIPYGESDARYEALIAYLSSANTIHAKLIKKM